MIRHLMKENHSKVRHLEHPVLKMQNYLRPNKNKHTANGETVEKRIVTYYNWKALLLPDQFIIRPARYRDISFIILVLFVTNMLIIITVIITNFHLNFDS